jgi:hypothetical protein
MFAEANDAKSLSSPKIKTRVKSRRFGYPFIWQKLKFQLDKSAEGKPSKLLPRSYTRHSPASPRGLATGPERVLQPRPSVHESQQIPSKKRVSPELCCEEPDVFDRSTNANAEPRDRISTHYFCAIIFNLRLHCMPNNLHRVLFALFAPLTRQINLSSA